jgi:hypothetical protein
MKQEEINRLLAITKNITNIQTLLGDLLMPISAMIQKYGCTSQQAVNMKLKAEEYLSKYGCMTLDSSVKAIQKVARNTEDTITTTKPQTNITTYETTDKKPKIIQQKIFEPTFTPVP